MLGHLFKVITNTLALRVKRNKRSLTLTSWLMITSLRWLLVGSEKPSSSCPLQDLRGPVDVFGVSSALSRVPRVYLTATDGNVALLNILSVNLAFDASAALFHLF